MKSDVYRRCSLHVAIEVQNSFLGIHRPGSGRVVGRAGSNGANRAFWRLLQACPSPAQQFAPSDSRNLPEPDFSGEHLALYRTLR